MSIIYWARFFRNRETGRYAVDVPDMRGCFTEGDTFEDAYRYLITEAVPGWLGKDPWPPARGPEEILGVDRFEEDPEPILVQVILPQPDTAALPEPLVNDFARAASLAGVPVAELFAQAAREFLARRPEGAPSAKK
ncbi:hypothetical protein FACS189460_3820 [Deltaproteobacteria bacterium]|nr:hypothetical protein FACS189460_3820 [Deltaproteobacteria bacterium]